MSSMRPPWEIVQYKVVKVEGTKITGGREDQELVRNFHDWKLRKE